MSSFAEIALYYLVATLLFGVALILMAFFTIGGN